MNTTPNSKPLVKGFTLVVRRRSLLCLAVLAAAKIGSFVRIVILELNWSSLLPISSIVVESLQNQIEVWVVKKCILLVKSRLGNNDEVKLCIDEQVFLKCAKFTIFKTHLLKSVNQDYCLQIDFFGLLLENTIQWRNCYWYVCIRLERPSDI